MRASLRPPPPPPPLQPPDILQILRDVKLLLAELSSVPGALFVLQEQIASLSQQLTDLGAHLDARFDAIEAEERLIETEINPAIPPTSLQFWSFATMALVTSISPLPGVVTELSVQDENGVNLPQGTITWMAPVGESAATDMTDLGTPNADSIGFDFEPSATAPSAGETFTTVPVWTSPDGTQTFVGTTPLTIVLGATVVPPPPPPTALQFNLMSGT